MELTRSDHPYITDLHIGDFFDGYYVLRSVKLGTTRANKPYLTCEFTDRTGRISGKLWEDAKVAYQVLSEGTVVKVRAGVGEYLGNPELKILRIRPAEEPTDMSRFLPSTDYDPEEDWSVIRWALSRMQHEGLKNLMLSLLGDEEFMKQFQSAPAGKRWHHGYLGGLLQHSASMVKIASRFGEHYPQLNTDILIAGAFLHDVGKLQELKYDTAIDYTVEGRLLGHIVLGADFVRKAAENVEGLDRETLVHLQHLILSHQGKRENGCPVEPMTPEAFVLYYLDEIDSKLNAIERELDKAGTGGGVFTDYINLLGRMLYKGGGLEDCEPDVTEEETPEPEPEEDSEQ